MSTLKSYPLYNYRWQSAHTDFQLEMQLLSGQSVCIGPADACFPWGQDVREGNLQKNQHRWAWERPSWGSVSHPPPCAASALPGKLSVPQDSLLRDNTGEGIASFWLPQVFCLVLCIKQPLHFTPTFSKLHTMTSVKTNFCSLNYRHNHISVHPPRLLWFQF